MKTRRLTFTAVATWVMAAACLIPNPVAAQSAKSPWIGVWQARLDGIPALELTLADDAGAVEGTIVFHLVVKDEKGPRSTSTEPHTLMHVSIQGDTISFQVKRGNGSAEILNMAAQLAEDSTLRFTCSNCGPGGTRAELDRMQ